MRFTGRATHPYLCSATNDTTPPHFMPHGQSYNRTKNGDCDTDWDVPQTDKFIRETGYRPRVFSRILVSVCPFVCS